MFQGAAVWLTHTLSHSVVFQVVICWRRLLLLLLLLLLQFRQINTGVRFTSTWTAFNYKCISVYTGCPRRNVKYFRRVFLMLNYTDITQNTFIQSWTVTEIMAREKCVHLAFPRTVPLQLLGHQPCSHPSQWSRDCVRSVRWLVLRRTSSAQRDKIAFRYCRYAKCLEL